MWESDSSSAGSHNDDGLDRELCSMPSSWSPMSVSGSMRILPRVACEGKSQSAAERFFFSFLFFSYFYNRQSHSPPPFLGS